MIVRPATDADAEALARVHVRSWQGAYAGLLPQELLDGLSVEQRAEQWRSILAGDAGSGRLTYVADDGGTVVAFAHVGPCRDEDAGPSDGEVYAIYADPERFGQGAGRALMDAALGALAAAGYRAVRLWVLSGNERAIRFYRAAGFRPDGARKDEPIREHPATERRYRLSLEP